MKKNIKYIIAGIIVIVFAIVVAWKDSQGVVITVDEAPSDSSFEEEVIMDDEENEQNNGLDLLVWEPTKENEETFFLIRNGVSYSLGAIDPEKAAKYLPVTLSGDNTYGGCTTYSGIVVGVSDSINNGFFSLGNVPVPVYEEGDKIIVYSSKTIPRLQLRKVNYYGDAIRLLISANAYSVYDDAAADKAYGLKVNNTEIRDSSGSEVEDIYSLNAGEIYTVSWTEGTKYNEITLPADSKFYVPESGRMEKPEYEIEGILTKDGYAEYNLSDVAPGTYKIVNTNDMVSQGLIIIE